MLMSYIHKPSGRAGEPLKRMPPLGEQLKNAVRPKRRPGLFLGARRLFPRRRW